MGRIVLLSSKQYYSRDGQNDKLVTHCVTNLPRLFPLFGEATVAVIAQPIRLARPPIAVIIDLSLSVQEHQ